MSRMPARPAAAASRILAAATFVAFAAAFTPPAAASSTGPCAIALNGVDAATEPARVDVPEGGQLAYHIASPVPTVRWVVTVHYGPLRIPVLDDRFPDDGLLVRDGPASVEQITRYGTGLYRVSGVATLADGTECTAQMQLAIGGSPFTSVLGLVALGVLGVGAAGVVTIAVRAAFDLNDVRAAVGDVVGQARRARQEAAEGVKAARAPASLEADRPGPGRR